MTTKLGEQPAFPTSGLDPDDGESTFHDGMTIRTWLAGQVAAAAPFESFPGGKPEWAKMAVELTDALLAELEK